MSRLSVPEMRRLLLAAAEPPHTRRLRHWWSRFRRQHQAGARRCHAQRRSREQPARVRGDEIIPLRSATCCLDDRLWAQVAALLPAARRRGDEPPLVYRDMLEGILWVARTGASWHDLPAVFGPWETVYATYHRWKQHGQWPSVLHLLQAAITPSS